MLKKNEKLLKLLNWNVNKVKINKEKNLKLLNWNENWKRNKNMNKVKGVNKM